MITPNDLPRLEDRFADPNMALNAAHGFVAHMSMATNRPAVQEGHFVSGEAREVLICGREHYWIRNKGIFTSVLIWRTEYHHNTVGGASGSTLFLGRLQDATSQAAVFRNFESSMATNRFWEFHGCSRYIDSLCHAAGFEGGFLLPRGVQRARIGTCQQEPILGVVSAS